MYMDIIWKETENDFIERAKANANFVFDTAKDYRRARIVSTIDVRGTQQIAYELERDLHNIDVFRAYFEGWYGNYGKFQHFTMRLLCMIRYSELINSWI